MSTPGLIQRFHELARVPAVGRPVLSARTISVYTSHVRAFYRFTGGKPAAQWTGSDVGRWMWQLNADGYAAKSRSQALCALVWVLRHVLNRDPGVLDLPVAPHGATIERIKNELGYSKENCRWATPKEQARNTRRNLKIEIAGTTKSLCEWSEDTGVPASLIRGRFRRGVRGNALLSKPREAAQPPIGLDREYIGGASIRKLAGKHGLHTAVITKFLKRSGVHQVRTGCPKGMKFPNRKRPQ